MALAGKTQKQLLAEQKKLNKGWKPHQGKAQKTAPDRKVYDAEKRSLEQKINNLKLDAAKKQWELQQKRDAIQEVQNQINAHKSQYEETNNRLQHLRSGLVEATETLKSNYAGRRITDPQERIKELRMEIAHMENELRNGQLSNAQETKTHRAIKQVQRQIAEVQEYIDNNVDDLVQAKNARFDQLRAFQNEHKSVKERQDEMYQSRRTMIEEKGNLEEEIKANRDEIARLIERKGDVQKVYEKDLETYRKWKAQCAEVREYLAILEAKKSEMANDRDIRAARMKEDKTRADAEAKARREAEERAARERAEAEERKANLENRRQKALLEYQRVQEKFKAAASQQEPEEVVVVPHTPVVYRHDPYEKEKHLCNTLITLCQSMKPSDSPSKGGKRKKKRKRKKTKISVSASNFSNFAEVGVKPPTTTNQLDKTIQALQERIEYYNNPPAEEPVVEDENEEEPEEAVAEEPEAEPVMEPVIEDEVEPESAV